VYFAVVLDAYSRRVVGWSIDASPTAALVTNALGMAIDSRTPPPGAVIHSDRGGQFRSHAYVRALRNAQLRGSMGRVGACADNAAMESFFSQLQKNVLNRQRWQTRAKLRLAIVVWIEKTYHRRRRQDALGRMTPIEFETLTQTAHAA
jgi:transposase InsO family protein